MKNTYRVILMILAVLGLILVGVPALLLGSFGIVMLVLKIIAVIQKAAESPTDDRDGQYSLDQGKDVGQDR